MLEYYVCVLELGLCVRARDVCMPGLCVVPRLRVNPMVVGACQGDRFTDGVVVRSGFAKMNG